MAIIKNLFEKETHPQKFCTLKISQYDDATYSFYVLPTKDQALSQKCYYYDTSTVNTFIGTLKSQGDSSLRNTQRIYICTFQYVHQQ